MADYVDEYRQAFMRDGGDPEEIEAVERAYGVTFE